ncbi:hypothetical protein GQ457_11G020640 [Hibiscus cannabinus]
MSLNVIHGIEKRIPSQESKVLRSTGRKQFRRKRGKQRGDLSLSKHISGCYGAWFDRYGWYLRSCSFNL